MVIQYLKNKHNGMFYRVIDNKFVSMWSPNAKQWIKCCTNYKDIIFTIDNFILIDEKDVK